jgi:hypothetical protein
MTNLIIENPALIQVLEERAALLGLPIEQTLAYLLGISLDDEPPAQGSLARLALSAQHMPDFPAPPDTSENVSEVLRAYFQEKLNG